MPNVFTQRFQVRFDECAPGETARASALLRYAIETAFGHSSAAGYPLAWYDQHGLFWLVRQARLELDHPVAYGAALEVTTRVAAFHQIWARRKTGIRDASGEHVGEVTLDWILTNRAGKPARVPPAMGAAFQAPRERQKVKRFGIGSPPEEVHAVAYPVPPHQLDPRGHMNSAAYLDLFEDALAGLAMDPQERPARYYLEYLRAVASGVVLRRLVWEDADGVAVIATLPDGAPAFRGHRGRRDADWDLSPGTSRR